MARHASHSFHEYFNWHSPTKRTDRRLEGQNDRCHFRLSSSKTDAQSGVGFETECNGLLGGRMGVDPRKEETINSGGARICSQRFFSRGQQSQIRRERSTKKRLSSMAQESSAARGKYLPCVRAMIVQIQSLSDTALLRENERGIMACIADILPVTIRRISVFQVFVAQPTAIKNRASM